MLALALINIHGGSAWESTRKIRGSYTSPRVGGGGGIQGSAPEEERILHPWKRYICEECGIMHCLPLSCLFPV